MTAVEAIELMRETEPTSRTAQMLARVERFVRAYCILDDYQTTAVALWVLHTHSWGACDTTPYLFVSSPEKRSGKTTLLHTLREIVARPLFTSSISEAALYRAIESEQPTLLFDEVDAIFNPKTPKEELRGILNAGFRRGDRVYRCGGANRTTLESFSPFGPKVLAGIGQTTLPDTIADRSIEIRMRRKLPAETVQRFRQREVTAAAEALLGELMTWGADHELAIGDARPALPDELDDRAQDLWEPLLAIADAASGEWPSRARITALALSGTIREDDSPRTKLLEAVRSVFDGYHHETIFSRELLRKIATDDDESPFRGWWNDALDKPESWAPKRLGQWLHEFGVPRSQTVRVDDETAKGYRLEWFADAFARYLSPLSPAHPSHPSHTSQPSIHAVTDVTELWRCDGSAGAQS